jgi:hypothetical protein
MTPKRRPDAELAAIAARLSPNAQILLAWLHAQRQRLDVELGRLADAVPELVHARLVYAEDGWVQILPAGDEVMCHARMGALRSAEQLAPCSKADVAEEVAAAHPEEERVTEADVIYVVTYYDSTAGHGTHSVWRNRQQATEAAWKSARESTRDCNKEHGLPKEKPTRSRCILEIQYGIEDWVQVERHLVRG